MARLVTLTQLQTRVKQRANVEVASNSALYTAAELTDSINEGIAELYDLIIAQQDQPYYLESTTFNTTSGTDTYAIGSGQAINISDFYKLRGIDVSFGQNIVNTARPFTWSERNRYKWLNGWVYSQPVFYHLTGKSSATANSGQDSIKFIPLPSGQFAITLWYYPTPPYLVSGSDNFDGINGFEEYAVLSAAIKLLTKQERAEHAELLISERARQESRILGMLGSHDAEEPPRVQDVTLNDGWMGRPGYW